MKRGSGEKGNKIFERDVSASESCGHGRNILQNYVPHAWIPGPGFAASLQLAGSIPNCPYIEYPCAPPSYSIDIWQMLLTEEIRIDKDGYVPVPQKPGLGVDLNEEIVRKYWRA